MTPKPMPWPGNIFGTISPLLLLTIGVFSSFSSPGSIDLLCVSATSIPIASKSNSAWPWSLVILCITEIDLFLLVQTFRISDSGYKDLRIIYYISSSRISIVTINIIKCEQINNTRQVPWTLQLLFVYNKNVI